MDSQQNENSVVCKYCNSKTVVKYGTYESKQRYWCKSCKRKFIPNDSLFRMKTTASQVSSSLNMYYI
jgi:transposase-like protein